VKYPDNFSDWIKQKKRSAGGYNQIRKIMKEKTRSFQWESKGGMRMLKYVRSFREAIWLISLFLSRVYLWISIYADINLRKKSSKDLWKRVESTK
jgi:hypothetical protein